MKYDMLFAVVADMDNHEHFVETYHSTESYETVRQQRLDSNSSLKFCSIFSIPKEAVREAKRISSPKYVKGWTYNESRNT